MKIQRRICRKCKTGMDTYMLDRKSEMCPHISSWEHNKCPFYDMLKKKNLFEKLLLRIKNITGKKEM